DILADWTVMRLGQGQADGLAGRLDLVGDERRPELFDQRRPVDVERHRQLPRRLAFDHFARDVQRSVGGAHDERAADLQVDLDRVAEKIFPAELGAGQRLPDLLRCGSDVDRVDERGFEPGNVHVYAKPSMLSAAGGIESGVPDSNRLLRLDRIAGHPLEMPSSILPPSTKPSCVSVNFTTLPCGSRVKTTFDGGSFLIPSSRTCLKG